MSFIFTLFLAISAIIILLSFRLIYVYFNPIDPSTTKGPAVIVLGSGGHTGEMLAWMKLNQAHLKDKENSTKNRNFIFIVSATDNHSAQAAKTFVNTSMMDTQNDEINVAIKIIPRAREVGQSYFSSIFSTLNAIVFSVRLMYDLNAATIISNGPGVAVPVVIADVLVAAFLPFRKMRRASLLYIESFACVDHISLSGKIFLFGGLCSKFLVQWPKLLKLFSSKNTNNKKINNQNDNDDVLQYSGPFVLTSNTKANDDDDSKKKKHSARRFSTETKEVDFSLMTAEQTQDLLSFNAMMMNASSSTTFKPLSFPPEKQRASSASSSSKRCVVTVGSTKFEDLIKVCNTPQFEQGLVRLGIDELLIQQGASQIIENGETSSSTSHHHHHQLKKKIVVNYKHGLQQDIQEASLVISHAGAGTILEAMNAKVPTVVVPNNKLMANHQLELALALASRGHLLCADVSQLIELLLKRNDVDWSAFVEMPPANHQAFNRLTKGYFQYF